MQALPGRVARLATVLAISIRKVGGQRVATLLGYICAPSLPQVQQCVPLEMRMRAANSLQQQDSSQGKEDVLGCASSSQAF